MGGGGLYSTALDYLKFVRMILDAGRGNGNQVLKPETVAAMSSNQIGDLRVRPLRTAIPSLSNDAEFFPGLPKTWGLSFMINEEDARPAARQARWLGRVCPICSIGSTARTGSAVFGQRRSSRSPIRPRSAATWSSRRRSMTAFPSAKRLRDAFAPRWGAATITAL